MEDQKTCTKCGKTKPVSLYYKDKQKPDGLEKRCKQCRSATQSSYYKENKDVINERNRVWQKANPQRFLSTQREYQREVYKRIGNVRRSTSRAKIKKRTPAWADMSEIAKVYSKAKQLTEQSGIQYHVDHIIPLNGELVSGLHIATNLQVITAEQNLMKSNDYRPF